MQRRPIESATKGLGRGRRGVPARVGGARGRIQRQLVEAYHAAGIVAAFVAFSALLGVAQGDRGSARDLGHATRLSHAGSPQEALRSTPQPMRAARERPMLWLVDGFNVLNVAVLRGAERGDFWGPDARRRLLELVESHAQSRSVVVVFDGPRPAAEGAEGTRSGASVVFAADADAWLLRRLREDDAPERVAVVTADRRLAARARHRGAQVVEPRRFVDECRPATRVETARSERSEDSRRREPEESLT